MNKTARTIVIANVMEWYDYSVFIYFGMIIAEKFFPSSPVWTKTSALFTVLVSFIVRPIGGILIGFLADRVSAGFALRSAILLMMLPTFMVGLLPSYATIGIIAPMLLILARILQGLGAGAQYPNSLIMVADLASSYHGFKTSMNFVASTVGFIFATLICIYMHVLIPKAIWNAYGWRIMFLATVVNLLFIPMLFRQTRGLARQRPSKKNSISPWQYLRTDWSIVLKGILLAGVGGAIYFSIFIALYQYQQHHLGYLSTTQGMLINMGDLALACLLVPLFAYCSDLVGRKPVLLVATLLLMLLSPLLMEIVGKGAWGFILVNIAFTLLASIYIGPISVVYTELFTEHRYMLTTFVYNLGTGLIGAATLAILPLLATHLPSVFDNNALGIYLSIAGLIGTVTLLLSQFRRN